MRYSCLGLRPLNIACFVRHFGIRYFSFRHFGMICSCVKPFGLRPLSVKNFVRHFGVRYFSFRHFGGAPWTLLFRFVARGVVFNVDGVVGGHGRAEDLPRLRIKTFFTPSFAIRQNKLDCFALIFHFSNLFYRSISKNSLVIEFFE